MGSVVSAALPSCDSLFCCYGLVLCCTLNGSVVTDFCAVEGIEVSLILGPACFVGVEVTCDWFCCRSKSDEETDELPLVSDLFGNHRRCFRIGFVVFRCKGWCGFSLRCVFCGAWHNWGSNGGWGLKCWVAMGNGPMV